MYDKTDVKQTHCVCYSLGAPPQTDQKPMNW